MRLREYLTDRRYQILQYVVIILFIGTIMYLEEDSALGESNGLYVIEVSFVLFAIYLVIEYRMKKKHFEMIRKVSKTDSMDWVNSIPIPQNFEQRIYQEILYKLYQDANRKLDEYSLKNTEDIDFISMWVHEIKTPIAASKLIIENSLDHPSEKILYDIEDEVDRIEDFVQMTLFYSRANDFAKDYVLNSISLVKIVEECMKREYSSIIHKKLTLCLDQLDIMIDTDEKWLGFILKQLLDNAIKYSLPEKKIKIYTTQTEKEIVLNVEDEGTGIKKEDLSRIFEKNFTGTNGRKLYNSTGIGLYLSRRLAEKLGHNITVTSEYGCGTKFSVHFPKWNNYYDVK